MSSQKWTASELGILKKLYPENINDILSLFPHRTKGAVHKKAKHLGLYAIPRWTQDEIDILKKHYSTAGSHVKVILPGKSRFSINKKAKSLNLQCVINPLASEFQELLNKHRDITGNKSAVFVNVLWTHEEIDIVRKNYAKMGYKVNKLLPHRTTESIQSRAKDMKITKYKELLNWSDEEIALIKELYPEIGSRVTEKLNDRKPKQVRKKAFLLGLKVKYGGFSWTEEENELIKKYYLELGVKGVRKRLPYRSEEQIRHHSLKLGVRHRFNKKWEQNEIEILKAYYPFVGSNTYVYLEGRTKEQTGEKARHIGLKFIGDRNSWDQKEVDILKQNYPIMGKECNTMLPNKSEKQILNKVRSLKLKSQRTRESGRRCSKVQWSETEIKVMHEYYAVLGTNVEFLLHSKTYDQIKRKAIELNLNVDPKRFKHMRHLVKPKDCKAHYYECIGRKHNPAGMKVIIGGVEQEEISKWVDVFVCKYCGTKREDPVWIETAYTSFNMA